MNDVEKLYHLFKGIGNLSSNCTLTNLYHRWRRVPFHLRKKVAAELKELEQHRIIEKVDGPTPWISPLVAVPKSNGKVRVCVDMRVANKAISRERHPTPTLEDLVHTLNGATLFSKLDLRAGYHQISLAPESQYITTFVTNKGLRRYKRLNFGINVLVKYFSTYARTDS